jgi:predicted amidophosphoribosyltransferase
VCVFWLGLAFWTFRDARRRIGDHWLVGIATLLGLVPFLGPLVYLLFRPPETLEEVHARTVEVRALEARLTRRQLLCPICRSEVESNYLICPVCTTQLKRACVRCRAPLEPLWQACPYCATPVGAHIEAVPSDLDAALTAEATAVGHKKPRGTTPTRARAS